MSIETMDLTCSHRNCSTKGTYTLAGECTNCGWTGWVTLTQGHERPKSLSGARCVICDTRCVIANRELRTEAHG